MSKPARKSAKKQPSRSQSVRTRTSKSSKLAVALSDAIKKGEAASKQARVIAMLQSPTGATLAAMMQQTGWQQHSVRGFLAGVVRKKLKLELGSQKVDGNRVYRIAGRDRPNTSGPQSKRRSA